MHPGNFKQKTLSFCDQSPSQPKKLTRELGASLKTSTLEPFLGTVTMKRFRTLRQILEKWFLHAILFAVLLLFITISYEFRPDVFYMDKMDSPKMTLGQRVIKTERLSASASCVTVVNTSGFPNSVLERVSTNISAQELLRRVNKLPHAVRPPEKHLLRHPYFSRGSSPQFVQEYINPILREPRFSCDQPGAVHFLVCSAPRDYKTRRAIREAWGSVAHGHAWPSKPLLLPLKLTFVLGVERIPNDLDSNSTTSSEKDKEAERDDILQFDMTESYTNLTRKVLLALKWALSSCSHTQYIVKVDQDVFANVPLLLSFLKHHGQNNSIYGTIYPYPNSPVLRGGKWAVSNKALPLKHYPSYAAGTSYVVSRDAAQKLVELSARFPYVPIEDAFITGVLAVAGSVDRVHVTGFTEWLDSGAKPCEFVNDKKYFAHGMSKTDIRRVWRQQCDRGRFLYCEAP